jgi:hypothetical protein
VIKKYQRECYEQKASAFVFNKQVYTGQTFAEKGIEPWGPIQLSGKE